MKPVTDLITARNLPEKDFIRYTTTQTKDGRIFYTPYFPGIVEVDYDDNAIVTFADTDGRLMEVGYDSEGAYKTEIRGGTV